MLGAYFLVCYKERPDPLACGSEAEQAHHPEPSAAQAFYAQLRPACRLGRGSIPIAKPPLPWNTGNRTRVDLTSDC